MLALFLSFVCVTAPQQPITLPQMPAGLPAIAAGNAANLLRFVDFHEDLDRPGVVAFVGQIDKIKEGRRQRLDSGKPRSDGDLRLLAGMQLFKLPAHASVQVRSAFFGEAKGKIEFDCDLQLTRHGDGSEHRQTLARGVAFEAGTLALFVVAPQPGGKKNALLHMIRFDPAIDTGLAPTNRFADTMHDFVAINRRVRDLDHGIADLNGARDDAGRQAARQALTDLLAQPVDLRQPEQQTLATAQTGPFELRARTLLGQAPPPANGQGH